MTLSPAGARRGVIVTLAVLLAALAGFWLLGRVKVQGSAYRQTVRALQLTQRMGQLLHAGATAEKQSVMTESDEDSRRFAADARNATAEVAGLVAELKALDQAALGPALERFEKALADYRAADETVLGLSVENSNVKALSLAFGPGAQAADELEQALRPALDGPSDAKGRQAQRALAEVQRLRALQTQHILERTDGRMESLERRMAAADADARTALRALGREGAAALDAYERLHRLSAEISELSRRNTNLRSQELSLDRKTRVLADCDQALQALEHTLRDSMASMATR